MQISTIIELLEQLAPLAYQESYDNSGLLTGDAQWNCSGAICSLDATEEVLVEAKNKGFNLVIAHHPILFHGIKQLTGKNYSEKALIFAIKHEIAIYAIHTNLDNIAEGVNKTIADRIGLMHTSILVPKNNLKANFNGYAPSSEPNFGGLPLFNHSLSVGAGLIGELAVPIAEMELLQLLSVQFGLKAIKHSELLGRSVKKIAICGGSGSTLILAASKAGADFYISSDFKYHDYFDANKQLVIADIGHWESEQFSIHLLFSLLTTKFPNFAVLKTSVHTNPVHYFLDNK